MEIRDLIRRLAEENAGWGAPKIHGESFKSSDSRYQNEPSLVISADFGGAAIPKGIGWRSSGITARRIVALDFFTVPTATFRLLYCLFVIEHGRRRILHFNVTAHPSADWVLQQLRGHFLKPGRTATLSSTTTRNSMAT